MFVSRVGSIGHLQISPRFGLLSLISFVLAVLLAAHSVSAQTVTTRNDRQNLPAQNHASRGILRAREGKLPEAEQELREAVRVGPGVASYRAQLGLLPSAEKNLRYVLERHPGDSGATLLLGLVKERSGDYSSAARLLDSQFDLVISQPDRTVA